MFESIFDDLKRYFQSGNMISRIIILNVAFFIVLLLVKIGLIFTGETYPQKLAIFTKYIAINEDMWFNLKHPWVFITHAFTHFGFFHILFNMLLLLWFGRIVGDLIGDRKVLPIYILGILAGIICFWLSAVYISPGHQIAYGASAAVMAIVVAAGFTSPDYTMNLIIIGPVRIKYIVAVLILLDLIALSNMQNTGGSFAHLGGALMGAIFVISLRNGRDFSVPINKIVDRINKFFENSERRIPKMKSPLKVSYKSDERRIRAGRKSDQTFEQQSSATKLDQILDKIKEQGINSLSKEEKQFLDQQSKKN